MLINLRHIEKGFSKNIFFNMRHLFCKMPHFRQMATKLNITVPKLNEQIQIKNQHKCIVYGIKELSSQNFINQNNEDNNQKKNIQKRKEKYFDQELQIGYQIDKSSKQTVDFDLAKRIASHLDLDICLMKQSSQVENIQNQITKKQQIQESQVYSNAVLSLSRFRQYVYREYYLKQLKSKSKRKYIEAELTNQNLLEKSEWSPRTKGSYKNRTKSIRIGQDSHINDMKNKQNQIQRWLSQGQRIIKIISHNNSDKSYKSIQKFCSMLDKQVQIVEQTVKQNIKKKPIIRYCAILQFQQEIQVDFDFINRRWRRRQAEIKLNQQGKTKKNSIFDIDFTKQDSIVQKAYLAAFDDSGIPYPKSYNFLTEFDKGFQKEGTISLVRQTIQEVERKKRQENINEFEDEQLTDLQRKQRDKQNRKIMQMRTVEDILQQMQQIKSREYEMQQYQSSRYKQLQTQLTDLLKNAKRYAQRVES